MVDLGFLDALKSIAHQLSDIRMRLDKLESSKTYYFFLILRARD